MIIRAVDEYNGDGHLIYSDNYIGAFVRGRTKKQALEKFPSEISQYLRWLNASPVDEKYTVTVVQEKLSDLMICDADSDVIFDTERPQLKENEYLELKALAMKSAEDFHALYLSIPIKDKSVMPPRKTFYGDVPITAEEMYEHTKSVNSYYFGEISVEADNSPDIFSCRQKAFETLEQQADFLKNVVLVGSYGEEWSLRKVCRRFIWHDRIHAKAMYKTAIKLCGIENVKNPFCFEL